MEELAQAVLTLGQRQWPHVDAVELKQVEGVQERHAIVLARSNRFRGRPQGRPRLGGVTFVPYQARAIGTATNVVTPSDFTRISTVCLPFL